MSDEEQVQIDDQKVRRHDVDFSQRLIALGFDPFTPVYAVQGGFDQNMISDALFGGSLPEPRVIPFPYEYGDRRNRSTMILSMEIESIRVVWVQVAEGRSERHFDDLPEWYIRGRLAQCELNPDGDPVRMHAYIGELDQEHCPSTAYLQMLREQPSKLPTFSLDGRLLIGDRSSYPTLT